MKTPAPQLPERKKDVPQTENRTPQYKTENLPKISTLALLQCPVTKSALKLADAETLDKWNQLRLENKLFHLDGSVVRQPIEAALINTDSQLLYGIYDDIAILLPTLAMTDNPNLAGSLSMSVETQVIQSFYEKIGWQKTATDVFEDAQQFEDLRPVMRSYIENCHLRVNKFIAPKGDFLLDAASGPIQYDAYLSYSEGYSYRICADISFSALKQAQQKLGSKGIYLLCDLTALPLKDNAVNAFVSLHTIYHIAAAQQITALTELNRVLKKGFSGVVVYSWGNHFTLMTLFQPRLLLQKIRNLRHFQAEKPISEASIQAAGFYFHAHPPRWFDEVLTKKFDINLATWRSLNVWVGRRFIKSWFFGKLILKILFFLENQCPRFLGRYGQYPLFIFKK